MRQLYVNFTSTLGPFKILSPLRADLIQKNWIVSVKVSVKVKVKAKRGSVEKNCGGHAPPPQFFWTLPHLALTLTLIETWIETANLGQSERLWSGRSGCPVRRGRSTLASYPCAKNRRTPVPKTDC